MNLISAKIVADSLNKGGDRLTTMEVVMPRIVLAEFNTHRMFSRNSASSKAIPFKRMVQMVKENPFIPIAWQKDHKGMQGTEYFTDSEEIQERVSEWVESMIYAVDRAEVMAGMEVTKQLCNRLLEPFMYHKVLVTSTEWENFFKLRNPQYHYLFSFYRSKKDVLASSTDGKDTSGRLYSEYTNIDWLNSNASQAEIHIQAVAEAMWDAMNESTPKQLKAGEWHIPYGDNIENITEVNRITNTGDYFDNQTKIKIATARCARISYKTLGEEPKIDYVADIKLHDMLLESEHMSPFEHCAQAMNDSGMYANFKGWKQYRAILNK